MGSARVGPDTYPARLLTVTAMRFVLALVLLTPALAAAQPALRLDLGLALTGPDETYQEVSVAAVTQLAGPLVVSAGVARATAAFSVHYAPGGGADIDPGFFTVPSYVTSWTALNAYGGVRLKGPWASMQVAAGPVLSVATLNGDDVRVGGGVGAEVGVLDVYPVPSVGLGLSLHGATTTSHTWAGGRVGVRVRL